MIIVLRSDATEEQIDHILTQVKEWGLTPHVSKGTERTIVGVIGDETGIRNKPLEIFPGVESVMAVAKPYKLASRAFHPDSTRVTVPAVNSKGKETVVGGKAFAVVAGPCSVESKEMLSDMGAFLKKAGSTFLRAGAFKPRTSPYSFQGLGVEGLRYLADVREETGLPIITEVMDTRDVEMVAEVADVIQIGARNMQNFNLLKVVGRTDTPVLIKRGLSSTIEELLMSAEYVMNEGNQNIILCERGIRTFEKATRNTLDLSAVPVLQRETHLPVVVDPSHATGKWGLIIPLARAAVAVGADGVMVEVHPKPEEALSDGPQALLPEKFEVLMDEMRKVAHVVGRTL